MHCALFGKVIGVFKGYTLSNFVIRMVMYLIFIQQAKKLISAYVALFNREYSLLVKVLNVAVSKNQNPINGWELAGYYLGTNISKNCLILINNTI